MALHAANILQRVDRNSQCGVLPANTTTTTSVVQSLRMVTACFLTEYLNISWVEGARWYHDTLVRTSEQLTPGCQTSIVQRGCCCTCHGVVPGVAVLAAAAQSERFCLAAHY